MPSFTFKKTFHLLCALVITANSFISALQPNLARAEAPSPPVTPAPSPTPTASPEALSIQGALPAPGDLPPEAETLRARQAIEAALAKYRQAYSSRASLEITNFKLEAGWAYAVAGELHVLAHRLPDATWQALLPDGGELYLQWLEDAPESLISVEMKREMQTQATIERRHPATPAVLPPVTSTLPEPVNSVSIMSLAGPTPLPTPVLSVTNVFPLGASTTQPQSKFDKVLSNGQFVYGPNIGTFDVTDYLSKTAPHLVPYAKQIYRRSEYYSINPKVYLTLMEMSTQLLSNENATASEMENPFGFGESGFLSELDRVSHLLFDAYYLHLYTYSPLPIERRSLPPLKLADGTSLNVPPEINAGTYAIIAALAPLRDAVGMATAIDNTATDSFYRIYLTLLPDDDPLSESNHIYIPGEIGVLAAPSDLLQLPYLRNESWKFNGVHDALGGEQGSSFSDASSIDFSPGWPGWNSDTSNMWVAAAAAGTPTKISNCNFRVTHRDGWETVYYHLENIQNFGSSINQNDKIGVLANTKPEAICDGGDSTGPHVHFTLKLNGARVPIDGTALSGWYVHSGRNNYDTDRNYMWLENGGTKKYVNDWLLNDSSSGGTCPAPTLIEPSPDGVTLSNRTVTFRWNALSGCTFNGYTFRVKTVSTMDSGGTTIIDTGEGGTQRTETINGYDNRDLYWGVKAANAPNAAWAVRRFRIEPYTPPPPPPNQWNAHYYKGHDCWNDTSMSCALAHRDYFDTLPSPGGNILLDKNWTGSPGGGVDPDDWTGLFETTINFPTNKYVFYVTYDDAIRFDLNGLKGPWDYNSYQEVKICNGNDGVNLSGNVPIKIYLKEYGGDAYIKLRYSTDTSVCLPTAPAPPSLTSPAHGTTFNEGDTINLSWSATGNEYYGEIWGGPGGTLTFGWQGGTSKNIGSQWAGYTYSWHIKARNSGGESGWSGTSTFTVKPAAPTNLNAQTASCSQVNLTWSDTGNEEGYRIYRNGSQMAQVGSNVTSYQDTGLSGNTTYNYYVRAYRGSIESNASSTVHITTPTCVVPKPDLVPTQWSGWQYPIVPSSVIDTNVVNTLYAGHPTYIDHGLANAGSVSTGGNTYGDLYVDGTRVSHYDFGDVEPGQQWAFIDWVEIISTPGWHTLRVVVDPDDLIDESDETNNTWEHQFYWMPTAPYTDNMENGNNDWTATGLWHQVGPADTYGASHSSSHSWWYGQNASGDYDTGSANSGDLTSPAIYIPTGGYYLRFWYRYETETAGLAWDQRWLQISMDGGPFNNVLQLYDDPQNRWLQSQVINLSGYAGHSIQVRFHFDTIDGTYNYYRGWYLDDFDISTAPPPSCTDTYEPNNSPAQATAITYGQSRNADLCPGGDYDFYKFTGSAGDRVVIDVDAETIGSALDSYIFLLDSDGNNILTANDDEILGEVTDSKLGYELPQNDTYYIKVRAWDHPSAGSSNHFYTIRLLTDATAPATTEITSPGSDGWLNPTLETVTVAATDNESGIRRVELLWHDADWQNSDWVWLAADEDGRDGWSFDFDTSVLAEQAGIAFVVWAFDWTGNWTGASVWNLGIDRTPPTVSAEVGSMYSDAPFEDFHLWWSGWDSMSGLSSYDIQYRDGTGGVWTDLLTNTGETYYRFVGQNGHTYYFRARARDLVGNQSLYAAGDGDAQYTVQICTAPSDTGEPDNNPAGAKTIATNGVWQPHNFHAVGDVDWLKFTATAGVTYTLRTNNTGGHADTMISLYGPNGTTWLAGNDDDPDNWPASRLEWGAANNGVYYVKVEHWDAYGYGCTTAYEVSIAETGSFETGSKVFVPIILK